MNTVDRATFDAMRKMAGTEFLQVLVTTFMEDSPRLQAELKQALDAGDAVGFRRAAHSLKSNAATFGALDMAAVAKQLEMLGKEQRLQAAPPLIAELDRQVPAVCTALLELCK